MNLYLRILALVGQLTSPLISYEIVAILGLVGAVFGKLAVRSRGLEIQRARIWMRHQFSWFFIDIA